MNGKRALITGGSHGIGLATAQALAAEGCDIALCSRTQTRLDAALERLSDHAGRRLTIAADVLKAGDIARVAAEIDRAWGGIDILINNVGGGGRWGKENIEQTDPTVWQEVYQKNAGAAVAFTCWAIPHMRANKWGRVVTVSSIYGHQGGGRPWFTMAKSAQIAMMKSLAMTPYLVRDGLTFNTVAPGSIMIPETGWEAERDRDPETFRKFLNANYPLGRLGSPEEVAAVIRFLCMPDAALVNGACIVADGGETGAF